MLKLFTLNFLLLSSLPAIADIGFETHYLRLGSNDTSVAIAADSAGNIFIVSSIQDVYGSLAIRASKTDPRGNLLNSFDFGEGYVPSGAAVDPQDNLVVVGTTNTPNIASTPQFVPHNSRPADICRQIRRRTDEIFKPSNWVGPNSRMEVFRSKLNGSLVAIDKAGNIYVTGTTP